MATNTDANIDAIAATSNDIQLQSLAQYTINNSYPYSSTSTSNTITTNTATTNTAYHATNAAAAGTNAPSTSASSGEQVDNFVTGHQRMFNQLPLDILQSNENRRADLVDDRPTNALDHMHANSVMPIGTQSNHTSVNIVHTFVVKPPSNPPPLEPHTISQMNDNNRTMTELDLSTRRIDSMAIFNTDASEITNSTNNNDSDLSRSSASSTSTPSLLPMPSEFNSDDSESSSNSEPESNSEPNVPAEGGDLLATTFPSSIATDVDDIDSNAVDDEAVSTMASDLTVRTDSHQISKINSNASANEQFDWPETTTIATSTAPDQTMDTTIIPDESSELTTMTDDDYHQYQSNSPPSTQSMQSSQIDSDDLATTNAVDDVATTTETIYRKYTTPPLATIIQMVNFQSRRISPTQAHFESGEESEAETVRPVYVHPTMEMTVAPDETTVANTEWDAADATTGQMDDGITTSIPTQRIASVAWTNVLAEDPTYIPRFQDRIPILPFTSGNDATAPSSVAPTSAVDAATTTVRIESSSGQTQATSPAPTSSTIARASGTAAATAMTVTVIPSTVAAPVTPFPNYSTATTEDVVPMAGDHTPAPTATSKTSHTSKQSEYSNKYDFIIYGILPNNTVVRKFPEHPMSTESPLVIYGILSNNTVLRKYPNGTIVADEKRNSRTYEVTDIDPRSLFNPNSELYRAEQQRQRAQLDQYYQRLNSNQPMQNSTQFDADKNDGNAPNDPQYNHKQNNNTTATKISTTTTTTRTTTTTSLSLNTTSNVNSTDNNLTTVFKLPTFFLYILQYIVVFLIHHFALNNLCSRRQKNSDIPLFSSWIQIYLCYV